MGGDGDGDAVQTTVVEFCDSLLWWWALSKAAG